VVEQKISSRTARKFHHRQELRYHLIAFLVFCLQLFSATSLLLVYRLKNNGDVVAFKMVRQVGRAKAWYGLSRTGLSHDGALTAEGTNGSSRDR
jgi:hypothetical protein